MRVAHGLQTPFEARSCRPGVVRIASGRTAAAPLLTALRPASCLHGPCRRALLVLPRRAVSGAGSAAAADQEQQQDHAGVAATDAVLDAATLPASPPAAPLVLSPPPAALQLQAALQELQDIQTNPPADDADAEAAASAAAAAAEAAVAAAAEMPPPVPTDVLLEFEQKLEADIASVFLTLTAVTGVIIYWRGVWSLLDYYLGDSVLGDVCCMIVGLTIVLWIRLSGAKVATSFWPPG